MRIFLFLFCFAITKVFSFVLGVETLSFYDLKRNRPVLVEVWYPTDFALEGKTPLDYPWVVGEEARNVKIQDSKKMYPLILFSHGQGGDVRDRLWLVENLVSSGYIVASIEHYGDTWDYFMPYLFLQTWNRPLDVSFALDKLLTNWRYSRNICQDKVGFIGFSLGGMTGIWLAGGVCSDFEKLIKRYQFFTRSFPQEVVDSLEYQKTHISYHDPRIKTYVFLAPSVWGFTYESLQEIQAPSLVFGAEEDNVLPPSSHAGYLAQSIQSSYYELLSGKVGHYVFLNCVTPLGEKMLDKRFYEDHPSINRKEIHKDISNKVLEFLKNQL